MSMITSSKRSALQAFKRANGDVIAKAIVAMKKRGQHAPNLKQATMEPHRVFCLLLLVIVVVLKASQAAAAAAWTTRSLHGCFCRPFEEHGGAKCLQVVSSRGASAAVATFLGVTLVLTGAADPSFAEVDNIVGGSKEVTIVRNNRRSSVTTTVRPWTMTPSEMLNRLDDPALGGTFLKERRPLIQETSSREQQMSTVVHGESMLDSLSAVALPPMSSSPRLSSDPSPLWPRQSTIMLTSSQASNLPFWNQPFAFQPAPDAFLFTNENVAGGSALALGAVYAASYAYYQYSIAQEEIAAQERKKAAALAAKKKKQAATAVVAELPSEDVDEQDLFDVAVATAPLTKEEEKALEKARAAVERAKRNDMAARMAEKHRLEGEDVDMYTVQVDDYAAEEDEEEEVKPKKKRWWQFWRRSKGRS